MTRLRFRILATLAVLLTLNAFAVLANRRMPLNGEVDFRPFYAAGALLRTHRASSLYNYETQLQTQNQLVSDRKVALPFLYPPYAALPFVPLSLLPFRAAYFTFLALNLALLALTARLLRPHISSLRRLVPPILLFLCFLPVCIALFQGQVSLLLLLLFTAAFTALEDDKPFQAGLYLALALIKFHVVLPVILLYALWRNWPLLRGFLTGAAALAALSLAIATPTGLRAYAQTLTAAATTGAVGTENAYNVFAAQMPNLQGLAYAITGPVTPGRTPWATLLVLLLSAAVLLYTALQPPSFLRALASALLVSYHLHLHDLTLLLLPIALTLNQALADREQRSETRAHHPAFHHPLLPTVTALLWLFPPLHLLLMGTGWKSLFAPFMLPFLLPKQPK